MKLVTAVSNTFRLSAVLLCSIATLALGQQNEPPSLAPTTGLPLPKLELPQDAAAWDAMPDPAHGLIRVDVAVTDKTGNPVVGLSKTDFSLLDNDQPQKIVTFQAFNGGIQPARSMEIVLVIDELNMLTNAHFGEKELTQAEQEAENFLRANRGVLPHPTMIYRLSQHGLFATSHASIDGNELADEIARGRREHRIWSPSEIANDVRNIAIGGEAGERITRSIIALGSIAIEERRKPGRKLVFWIGNGWQIEGRRAAAISDFSIELLTRMREARINLWGASEWPLYDATGIAAPVMDYADKVYLKGPKPESTDLSYLSLPVIATRSGGGMLATPHHLAALITQRVKEESSYYSFTFDPPRDNVIDEYHHLQIQIGKPDLTAHVFEDYYDEPVFYDQPPARQLISVKQLEALISDGRNTSRADMAHRLENMQLTERLNSAKLAELARRVRGREARESLEVLADESVFLPPPAEEILSTPPPDPATQHQIISNVITYINTTVPKLPDFFATRITVQYHEPSPKKNQTWKTETGDQTLRQGETASASLRFHDGKEHVGDESLTGLHQVEVAIPSLHSEPVENALYKPDSERLQTIGTFGPILITVMRAATLPNSELSWARWEQGLSGPLAVFSYRVPQETPFFTAGFCCLADDFGTIAFKKAAPFHGEIAVDPSTGAVMRLTIQADLEWRLPLERSDVMVEYRPVAKSTRTFICPSRAVSISRQRRTMTIEEWGEGFRLYAPFETLLNEMRFEKYRVFGSTSRIVPGFVEVPEPK